MSEEQSKSFVDQATQSIQAGQFAQALEFLEQAVALTPNDSEAYVLQGICLSQLGRADDATSAFRKAITVSPYNAKAYFNLAVHQYQIGDKVEALAMAEEAAKIDVKHANARALIEKIRSDSEPKPAQAASAYNPADPLSAPQGSIPPRTERPAPGPSAPSAPGQPYTPRGGYEAAPAGGITFIQNMGPSWVLIGWVLALMSLVALGLSLSQMAPLISAAASGNSAQIETLSKQMQQNSNPLVQVLSYGSLFGILLWTIMDLIDRKGNFVWLIPQVLCSCCGFGWLILPIYILAGRK
ncbi:MAG: tetratricopeptide repeat protein [Fimbriimonas sp.]